MVYLDCAASAPIDPRVTDLVLRLMGSDYGNAGSRSHPFGQRARKAVEQARGQIADAVAAGRGEVVFTSGATESNNLAILGLEAFGRKTGRMHIVSSRIEHNAVLEPLALLRRRGFDVSLLPPTTGGWVDPDVVRRALRPETLLVSVMHVNNETGVIQPIPEIARALDGHDCYFHVDAAQGFGKLIEPLRNPRIDLLSISGHKVNAPQGVGALIGRRRGTDRPPLSPLIVGGGQEWGLRPGTLPVPLIAALGLAADLAVAENQARTDHAVAFRKRLLSALAPLNPRIAGDPERSVPHILNLSLPGIDSETAAETLDGFAAVSNGSACTSHSLTCSHVLSAMGFSDEESAAAIRWSWSHLTPEPDWAGIVAALKRAREPS